MSGLARRARIAAIAWVVVAFVAWNVIYDLLMVRAVKEYLLRYALHQAGRGPAVTIAQILEPSVPDAVWKATVFASCILLAGLLTIRALVRPAPPG